MIHVLTESPRQEKGVFRIQMYIHCIKLQRHTQASGSESFGFQPQRASPRQNQQWFVRPAKTQISLRIRAVLESSLIAYAFKTTASGSPKRAKWEPLPYWVDVQTGLSLCWSHRSYCRFCRALAQWLPVAQLALFVNLQRARYRFT